mgnify:FL=1
MRHIQSGSKAGGGWRRRFNRAFHGVLLLAAATAGAAALAVPYAPGGQWTFDGSLADSSGNGLHAGVADEPHYVAARDGQALRLEGKTATIPDAPGLRLARGLRLEARVRFDAQSEGGQLAFFINLNGKWVQRGDR